MVAQVVLVLGLQPAMARQSPAVLLILLLRQQLPALLVRLDGLRFGMVQPVIFDTLPEPLAFLVPADRLQVVVVSEVAVPHRLVSFAYWLSLLDIPVQILWLSESEFW